MGNFNFNSINRCEYCGNYLASSDNDCDSCSRAETAPHFFRHTTGRKAPVVVRSKHSWRWYRLAMAIGDSWKEYEWVGTRSTVHSLMGSLNWDEVGDLPTQEHPVRAPNDIEEEVL